MSDPGAKKDAVMTIRSLAFAALGAVVGATLPASLPAAADEPLAPVRIEEWRVPFGGRPRDPFAAGPDEIWFVGQLGNYIARLTPSSGEFVKHDLTDAAGPHNLIVGSDGIVWYAANSAGYIGRYDPAADSFQRIDMPDPAARDPHTLLFDADESHIWFTVQGGNFVGRLTVATRAVELKRVPTRGARPYGIRMAPDGTPWVALLGTNRIASVDPETLEITEHAIPATGARPRRIEVSPDGRVWYSDYARGRVGMFDPASGTYADWALPAGQKARPYGTAMDDRDRLWVAETGFSPVRLVGFDTRAETVVSVTPIPSGGGAVRHMDFYRPTGDLWFGTDGGTIGRATVAAD